MPVWRAIGFVLVLGGSVAQGPCVAPLWTADLVSKYHFETFAQVKQSRHSIPRLSWQTQRGITFTSADTLVVYQVIQDNTVADLGQRDASGGGGKFTLRALFLDTRNGNVVREKNWTTSASDFSQVYGTHDGRFVVRTGQLLRSYSSDFQEIASKPLPVNPENFQDIWMVSIVPPGRLLFAEHDWQQHQATRAVLNVPWGSDKSLLDADTLKTIQDPSPDDVALWPKADFFFPKLARSKAKSVLSTGPHTGECTHQIFAAVPRQNDVIDPPCKKLNLLTPDGSLWWHLDFSNEVCCLGIGGNTLAVDLEHWSRLDYVKRLRITVYDLAGKTEKCSVNLTELRSDETYDFAVSSSGLLVVRLGNQLSVYKP